MAEKVVLYFAPESSPSQAVWMTARAANIALVMKSFDLCKMEQKTADFKKINPEQVLPTIDDNGFYLWESRSIMKYLIDNHTNNSLLYPKDSKKRASIDRLLDFDIGQMVPAVKSYQADKKSIKKNVEEDLNKALSKLEMFLEHGHYLTGDIVTIADLSLICTIVPLLNNDYDMKSWKLVSIWIERCKGLSYFAECSSYIKKSSEHGENKECDSKETIREMATISMGSTNDEGVKKVVVITTPRNEQDIGSVAKSNANGGEVHDHVIVAQRVSTKDPAQKKKGKQKDGSALKKLAQLTVDMQDNSDPLLKAKMKKAKKEKKTSSDTIRELMKLTIEGEEEESSTESEEEDIDYSQLQLPADVLRKLQHKTY